MTARALFVVLMALAYLGCAELSSGGYREDGALPASESDAARPDSGALDAELLDAGRQQPLRDAHPPASVDASASTEDAAGARLDAAIDAGSVTPDAGASRSDAAVDAASAADAASARDAGNPGPGDAGGRVPVFLAMGYGTRRVVSCDFGLTWLHDEVDVPNGGDDGTLVRGLAAGAGMFVAAVGGGGVQKLFSSTDAVAFTRFDRGGNGFSDVSFGNGRFVAGGGHVSAISLDGRNWEQPGGMGAGGILRHLGFGNFMGGRFVAVGDSGRRMSSADGVTWGAQVEEGPGLRGVAFGAGVFVAISDGAATRYSEDGGASWKAGSITGAAQVRGILFDGARFIVTTAGDAFTSNDGKTWTQHAESGGPGRFDVSDDRAHYAGAEGSDLFHSLDGIHFERVKQGGQGIERVKFARVAPSATCPLR